MSNPLPLSLDGPPALSLFEEPPVLDLGIPSVQEESPEIFIMRLRRDSQYLSMEGSALLGACAEGYQVREVHDVLPPQGDKMYRELVMKRI